MNKLAGDTHFSAHLWSWGSYILESLSLTHQALIFRCSRRPWSGFIWISSNTWSSNQQIWIEKNKNKDENTQENKEKNEEKKEDENEDEDEDENEEKNENPLLLVDQWTWRLKQPVYILS